MPSIWVIQNVFTSGSDAAWDAETLVLAGVYYAASASSVLGPDEAAGALDARAGDGGRGDNEELYVELLGTKT